MRIDILTLFPEIIESYISSSVLGNAHREELYKILVHNPRNYSNNKHKKVDDTAFGGGPGMLLMPQPFFDCLEAVLRDANIQGLNINDLQNGILKHPENRNYEIISTSPSGETWSQELAKEFAQKDNLIILCGRYEGFDQRIKDLSTREISLGDFILTGGEIPAMAILDSTLRLQQGVLGDFNSLEFESFNEMNLLYEFEKLNVSKKELNEFLENTELKNKEQLLKIKLLEFPQYTQPEDFRGLRVPSILRSGDHKKIFLWRLEQAIKLTRKLRPDLLDH